MADHRMNIGISTIDRTSEKTNAMPPTTFKRLPIWQGPLVWQLMNRAFILAMAEKAPPTARAPLCR
jgi:hypothetical protein